LHLIGSKHLFAITKEAFNTQASWARNIFFPLYRPSVEILNGKYYPIRSEIVI